jgi:hypothetical protein
MKTTRSLIRNSPSLYRTMVLTLTLAGLLVGIGGMARQGFAAVAHRTTHAQPCHRGEYLQRNTGMCHVYLSECSQFGTRSCLFQR